MKSLRFVLLIALSLSAAAFAQSNAAAPSEAQKSFDVMKALAGAWQGPVTVVPKMEDMKEGTDAHVTLRVTSRGNALVHEMKDPSTPDDPTKYDDPITMIYRDGEQLYLVHYCDAGNRPRMAGKVSPDGKQVEFDFVDITGSLKHGHMQHAVFTIVDTNHHIEDWTYLMPGDKPVHAHLDLRKVN